MSNGRLYMIPVPIADGEMEQSLPISTIELIRSLRCFLVENAKTARAFLKLAEHPGPIADLTIIEIGHRPDLALLSSFIKPLKEGNDVGILSEAGCPGIADPGAQVAALAQKEGIRVVPMVGPCSMILALMASGLDGQHFRFSGYVPIKEPQRTQAIVELERLSSRGEGETQLFIETPYRNTGLLRDLVKNCHPSTRILVASDITGKDESIRTQTAAQWAKENPELPKLPTIFGLLASEQRNVARKFPPKPVHSKKPRSNR